MRAAARTTGGTNGTTADRSKRGGAIAESIRANHKRSSSRDGDGTPMAAYQASLVRECAVAADQHVARDCLPENFYA